MDIEKILDRYPSVGDLEARAKQRIPHFGWEYLASGTGIETGLQRNRAAIDAVCFTPRLMRGNVSPQIGTELFGRTWSAPFGIAPVGLSGLMWPDAEGILARTARDFNIPYCLSTVACETPEAVGAIAGGNCWFQLYPIIDKEIEADLVKRAADSGFSVLVVTVDVPENSTRERQRKAGMRGEPRMTPARIAQILARPRWALETLRHGAPSFPMLHKYSREKSLRALSEFLGPQRLGEIDTNHLAQLRKLWKGPMVIKGIMHPDDAEIAVGLGADGIVVSNHGARQIDGTPASIEVLPAIARRVNGRAAILFDSGVRTGLDVMRALAMGADFVLCGRAFLFGVGALGQTGGDVVAKILRDDIVNNMHQIGASTIGSLSDYLHSPEAG
ncbi:MAG: alpha-hydroxy-acid oxidizing protein [Nitratireductor sp.]|nr:alpha-hydroxy-acid oxidizing protein [Nitratireductor sp.]MCB1458057.1 alpha-hydroxy-acid oxidizing protein [Nitratireductor sp.]